MDKDSFETYEYLPVASSDTETNADQFFVVQDDGTFLINRQVTMVTDASQIQDVKLLENVQPCTVYDVTPQQFFVDVDNSGELMSTSDQFIIPNGSNSIYPNNYLLQSDSSTSDQIENDSVRNNIKAINMEIENEVVTETNKQGNNFTEITLSDDQYHMLEQKGWVLLELNNKVLLLDTLGLHDITSNHKLIQKLKGDIQSGEDVKLESGSLKVENISCAFQKPNENLSTNDSTVQYVIENNILPQNEQEDDDTSTIIINEQEVQNTVPQTIIEEKYNVEPFKYSHGIPENIPDLKEKEVLNEEIQIFTVGNTVNIKTTLIFKDIPDKIVLGKTPIGKNLVARVVKNAAEKRKHSGMCQNKNKINCTKSSTIPNNSNVTDESTTHPLQKNEKQLTESKIETLITNALKNVLNVCYTEKQITVAEAVIAQLHMPDCEAIINRNLVVSKVLKSKMSCQQDEVPIVVTGKITLQEGQPRFVHMPNLIQKLISKSEKTGIVKFYENEVGSNQDENFIHLHISELKTNQFIVTINKELFLPFITEKDNVDQRTSNTRMFACGGCAELFKSEDDFKQHQETLCMEPESVLTIDTDKINNIGMNGIKCLTDPKSKEKVYSCLHCDRKFNRITNCQRHLKTHKRKSEKLNIDTECSGQKKTKTEKEAMYKCKMCSCSYYYSSTLTKHIVTVHLKLK